MFLEGTMDKFYKKLLAMLGVLAVIMFTVACEGPEGPAGKDGANGTDGKDGKDGSAICAECHGTDDMELKMAQYDLSKHNKGIVYEEEAGRISCGGCHTGDGFAEAASLGQNDPVTHATSKINCLACHEIHTKYNTEDWALRIKTGFNLRFTGAAIDLKEGNTCAKCHQARTYARTTPDTIKPASATATYSRFGPHYGTPANVVTMNGPYAIINALPTDANPHAGLAKGCVSCHLGKDSTNPAVGGHSFLMSAANLGNMKECYGCHDKTAMTDGSLTKDIANKLVEYRRILIDKGWLDTSQALTEEGYQILGEYFRVPSGQKFVVYTNPKDVEVILNYLYVAKDRSLGVHNPKYIKAIVDDGLTYLKQ
jgi:hypothetical protein